MRRVVGFPTWSWKVHYKGKIYGETINSKDKDGKPFTEKTFREKAEKKWAAIKSVIDARS